jgi:PHD/YefM family antitoxin component YafN of YafNO toxin-antitoxin module
VAEALKAAKGRPIAEDVPGFDHRFVVIDQAEYDAAMAELDLQKNVALIREGIADVEAGRVQPLEEAMDDIRRELGFRPRQTT